MSNQITCPKCNHTFSAETELSKQIEQQLRVENEKFRTTLEAEMKEKENKLRQFQDKLVKERDEQEQKIKAEVELRLKEQIQMKSLEISQKIEQDNLHKMQLLEQQFQQKQEELQLFRKKEIDLLKQSQELKDKLINAEQEKELAMIKQKSELIEKQAQIEADAKKKAEEQVNLKLKETEKQIEDQKKLITEMQRKIEQGSMQLQGEALELVLEEMLKSAFPMDSISEVAKGVKGADIIQSVRNNMYQECGKIIYESKRTKSFSESWLDKLKTDLRNQSADIAVLVTETLPKDIEKYGLKEGIWVCTFQEVKGIAMMLRESLIKINEVRASQTNKGDKMQMLYDYLTQKEFKGQLEAIVEGFTALQKGLEQEKRTTMKLWKEREKQIEKVMLNTSEMYGNIRGIAGVSAPTIKELEYERSEE